MEDPPSSPEIRRICPHCKRPVAPGYKFCEVCGTRIPSLYTCSKCGTQFVHLKKYCDACGALFVPKEIPEHDTAEEIEPEEEVLEPEAEERAAPGEEEIPEQEPEEAIAEPVVRKKPKRSGKQIPAPEPEEEPEPEEVPPQEEEEIPEPGQKKRKKRPAKELPAAAPEEVPEAVDEELPAPAEKKRQKKYSREIREPPTEEILREFGEDEKEDSATKGRRGLFGFLGAKKQKPPESPDEALFLTEKGPKRKKSRGSWLKIIIAILVIVGVLAAAYFFGLSAITGLFANILPIPGEVTPTPEPTAATPTATPTTVPGALTTLPTETIPSDQKFDFSVQKHPVTQKITVIFIGSSGSGSDSIVRADIVVTHDDGSVSSGVILPLKGITEVPLNGSGSDRVVIIARMASGDQYRVYDKIISSTSEI